MVLKSASIKLVFFCEPRRVGQMFSLIKKSRDQAAATLEKFIGQVVVVGCFLTSAGIMAHEVDQRFGGYSASDGESRFVTRFLGRADTPSFAGGDGIFSLSISAQSENIKSDDTYTQKNFEDGRRLDRSLGLDGSLTWAKRSEFTFGGSAATDAVSRTTSARVGFGQWFLGDQLRLGVQGSSSKTTRPADSFLDYDSATVTILPEVSSTVGVVNFKAILNPKTTVSGDYAVASSSERPLLRAWSVGVKQYFDACDCAVHGDAGRVINLGKLDTNMSAGELTGSQFSISYLQSLWQKAHSRLSYRYAREDEFTRAYEDHLVFGADSYVAALSQELDGVVIGDSEKTLLLDLAATRYLHNKAGSATTVELGGSVKF
jgi:hypothetical protein